jgi:hypothetical protein
MAAQRRRCQLCHGQPKNGELLCRLCTNGKSAPLCQSCGKKARVGDTHCRRCVSLRAPALRAPALRAPALRAPALRAPAQQVAHKCAGCIKKAGPGKAFCKLCADQCHRDVCKFCKAYYPTKIPVVLGVAGMCYNCDRSPVALQAYPDHDLPMRLQGTNWNQHH